MDYGTPDDNIFAMAEVVERYRRSGIVGPIVKTTNRRF
jgi:hypothetical protein